MQGLQCLLPPKTSLPSTSTSLRHRRTTLTIDAHDESPQTRIDQLIRDHPVVIFARRGCCMCHVMKRLLAAVGAHPSVIELEEGEVGVFVGGVPALFVGGILVGGIEGLMAMHLSEELVPRLREAGAV